MSSPSLILVCLSGVLLLAAVVFRNQLSRPAKVTRRSLSVCFVILLGMVLGRGLPFAFGYRWNNRADFAAVNWDGMLNSTRPATIRDPLDVGDRLPDLEKLTVGGWINGPAPLRWDGSQSVIVLDVWANW